MSATDLVALVCCDLGAIVRGRSVFASELGEHLAAGVGWVPANHSLTPLGTLAESTPFSSVGDLRLLPDIETHVRVEAAPGHGETLDFVLCDIVETDGAPWSCCPRQFLREALEALTSEFGVSLRSSFEHEFQLLSDAPAGPRARTGPPRARIAALCSRRSCARSPAARVCGPASRRYSTPTGRATARTYIST